MSTATVTTRDVLIAWKSAMADPDRVVFDPRNLSEKGGRASFRGCGWNAAEDLGTNIAEQGGPTIAAEWAVLDIIADEKTDAFAEPFTPYHLNHGRLGCVEAIDRAIASLGEA